MSLIFGKARILFPLTGCCWSRTLQQQGHRAVQVVLASCLDPQEINTHPRRQAASLAEQFKQASTSESKHQHPNITAVFRTHESNPTHHTLKHEGLFYTVSEEHTKRYLQKGVHPEFRKQIKTFQEACLMVRKPALEIFELLNQFSYGQPLPRIVIYGKRGCGKSSTLAHVIHHCAVNDWVIVHLPWPAFWLGHYKEVSTSSHKSHHIDLPIESAEWLQHFRTQNPVLLKEIVTTQTYKWTARETAEEGMPILELIDFGLNRIKFATDCVGVILKEIRRQASQNKFRVLVAIDGVNSFWHDTTIKTDQKEYVPAQKLSLVHNFMKMLKSDWTNGVVVCTVDECLKTEPERQSYTPLFLLGKEGFEVMDPFIPVVVNEYSDKEIHSCLEYYIDRMWIQNPKGQTEEGKKELIFLSSKNPYVLTRMCAAW